MPCSSASSPPSNVPLDSFFWHDRIPTDAAAATVLTTGTYSTRLNYRILYKTNYQTSYQVLASNLLTTTNYSFALNAIPKQAGEVVTDIYFDFGKVPAGFQSLAGPTLTVNVSGTAVNGYQLVNRADAGGKYQGTWQTAQTSWVTIIRKYTTTPQLPKTAVQHAGVQGGPAAVRGRYADGRAAEGPALYGQILPPERRGYHGGRPELWVSGRDGQLPLLPSLYHQPRGIPVLSLLL